MLMTELTKDALRIRRGRRLLMAEGFIPVGENGDPLWKFQRGAWTGRKITEVRVDPGERQLWIKVSP